MAARRLPRWRSPAFEERHRSSILGEILRGGSRRLNKYGVTLIVAPRGQRAIMFGYSVTGVIDPSKIATTQAPAWVCNNSDETNWYGRGSQRDQVCQE